MGLAHETLGENLWTAREGGSLIGYYEAPDGENEAESRRDLNLLAELEAAIYFGGWSLALCWHPPVRRG